MSIEQGSEIMDWTDYKKSNVKQSVLHAQDMANELLVAGETPVLTFSAALAMMEQGVGSLHVASLSGEVVGYASLITGTNPVFKRLYFFAIRKKFQERGLGKAVLSSLLAKEFTEPNSGLTVACRNDISAFYEKCGFVNTGKANDSDDDVLVYSNNPLANHNKLRETPIYVISQDVVMLKRNIDKIEAHYKVKLLRD
jgi:ribosomal protein S18 acetylase RimI-like enzyme